MKQITIARSLCLAIVLLVASGALQAQTITINSVSASTFCAGDPIAVNFTVTGMWGASNAFTLQLSDPSGSFGGTFTSLGSIIDTAPGTFTIVSTIPLKMSYSDRYRVRVIGAYPFVTADNGSDLLIGAYPKKYDWGNSATAVAIGIPHRFIINETFGQQYGETGTVFIDFGDDANPRTQTLTFGQGMFNVTYSTGGLKTLVVRNVTEGGCSASDTLQVYVYDCTTPEIPHNAIIVSSNDTKATYNKTYWVNPGISFNAGYNDTVFAEAGASILGYVGSNSQTGNVVYLKPGATSNIVYNGVVVYAPGASVDISDMLNAPSLECTGLSFGYTSAPPNSVMHINENGAAVSTDPITQIRISPNPTNNFVTLEGIPENAHVTAVNVLGETVADIKVMDGGEERLQFSNEAAGIYYIRIVSDGSVITKKIVKE